MSISAMEDRGDDYTSTDHHNKPQDFDDLADDKAHDGRASEHLRSWIHGSLHKDSIDNEMQYEDECFSGSDRSRCSNQSWISNSGFDFQAELPGNNSKDLDDYNNTDECVNIPGSSKKF